MVKIHIIGGPGSGKTTLAQDLSSTLHVPHYDLDRVSLEPEKAVSIAEQPAWITEGIYLILTEPMLYHADHIILLTTSWPTAAERIIRRHVLNSLRGTQLYPGIHGIKLLFKLLKGTRRYYLNQDRSNNPSIEALYQYLDLHREIAAPPGAEFVRLYAEAFQQVIEPPTEEFARMYLARYKEKVVILNTRADLAGLIELLTRR